MNKIIQHSCRSCRRQFFLFDDDVKENIDLERYIVCPYCSSQKLKVNNLYENLKECMEEQQVLKRDRGRLKRI